LTILLIYDLYFIEILAVCRQPVVNLQGGPDAPAPLLSAHMGKVAIAPLGHFEITEKSLESSQILPFLGIKS